ncbi:MAG: hypothetical protein AAFN43_10630 [Pseudomonadota bacterium]
MVNRGFSAEYLDGLDEVEFISLFQTQTGLDEERAKAEEKAWKEARRRKG